MAKSKSLKVRWRGAYKVKAAESRSARVAPKSSSRTTTPSRSDKSLAEKLLSQRAR